MKESIFSKAVKLLISDRIVKFSGGS